MKSFPAYARVVGAAIVVLFAIDSFVLRSRSAYHQPPAELAAFQKAISWTKEQPEYTISSWTSQNGDIQHYTLERSLESESPSESVLFASITRDEESWGRNPTEDRRSVYSYLDFITNTTLQSNQASVAILTSSPSEYARYIQILTPDQAPGSGQEKWANATYYDYAFRRIVLVLHTAPTRSPPTSEYESASKPNTDASRAQRHNIPQHERRAILAKLRNYLQSVALKHESHILWLDSDVYKFSSKSMVSAMISKTTTKDHEVGILTSRCRRGEPELAEAWMRAHPEYRMPNQPPPGVSISNELRHEIEDLRGHEGGQHEIIAHITTEQGQYDLNAWTGRRTGPNNLEQELLWKDLSSWEPRPGFDGLTKILDAVIEGTNNDDIRQLDSVGGTILMINADLIRMGLVFPTGYIVGMTYEHGEGFDGIETEGLCVLTRSFSRDGNSTCWTMGGDWSVWHTVF